MEYLKKIIGNDYKKNNKITTSPHQGSKPPTVMVTLYPYFTI